MSAVNTSVQSSSARSCLNYRNEFSLTLCAIAHQDSQDASLRVTEYEYVSRGVAQRDLCRIGLQNSEGPPGQVPVAFPDPKMWLYKRREFCLKF